jgi:head-tail adaptor
MMPVLNRRLVLEEAQRASDGAGGARMTWVAKGTLWAEVTPVSSVERAGESLTVSAVRYRIVVRAAAQGAPSRPKPDQRFRNGARLYRIAAVTEADARGRYLLCAAIEETVA